MENRFLRKFADPRQKDSSSPSDSFPSQKTLDVLLLLGDLLFLERQQQPPQPQHTPKTQLGSVSTLLNSGSVSILRFFFWLLPTKSNPEDLELQLAAGQVVPFLACFCGFLCEVG